MCSHYHAAMTQQEREEVQANWTHDRMQIIVATIAFGMGESCACIHHAGPDIPIHASLLPLHTAYAHFLWAALHRSGQGL